MHNAQGVGKSYHARLHRKALKLLGDLVLAHTISTLNHRPHPITTIVHQRSGGLRSPILRERGLVCRSEAPSCSEPD